MNIKTWCLGVLVVSNIFSVSVSAETLTVDEAPSLIRVDGHLTDWPEARMILLDQPSQVNSGKAFWKTSEDFSGRIFLSYDPLYLYVAAIVQKRGTVVNDGSKLDLLNGDCLELFISTVPPEKHPKRLVEGDFHIGFSPGTGCKNPQMFCFNKNSSIQGGRLIARPTKTGYLLEACIPLAFFSGLEIGPGKTTAFNVALDEGGSVSGNLLVRLDYSGEASGWESPAVWNQIKWIGKTEVSIPRLKREDSNVTRVQDGTRGATYLGFKNIQGVAVDAGGKPLADARISTWPKTTETLADTSGHFSLPHVKTYDKTFLIARREGFSTALLPLSQKAGPVTLRLNLLPPAFDEDALDGKAFFYGTNLLLPGGAQTVREAGAWIKDLAPKILRLKGVLPAGKPMELDKGILDRFVAAARSVGAEPMVEIPLSIGGSPDAAEWVRYCNVEKKYNVRFWAVGNDPDLFKPGDYSVYDYINDFRFSFNAMKALDPSILIVGPELGLKYGEGEEDWLTPFVKFDGDIVDVLSVHRYSAESLDLCSVKSIQENLRGSRNSIRRLKEKVSNNSDRFIPLALTGNDLFPGHLSGNKPDEAARLGFWPALWTAESTGAAFDEGIGMNISSVLGEGDPGPEYWAMKMMGALLTGKRVPARINRAGLLAYAAQDPQSKDVTLVLINKSDNYYRPVGRLDGKDADLTVEAGLDQKIDYEIPSLSISCLKIKSDHSPGNVTLYTQKMQKEGKPPSFSEFKPW